MTPRPRKLEMPCSQLRMMMMMMMMMSYHASLNTCHHHHSCNLYLVALTANQVVFVAFQANREGYER